MTDPQAHGPACDGTRLIGANTLIQTALALQELEGAVARDVLGDVGEAEAGTYAPDELVDERRFAALVSAMLARLGEARTGAVMWRSGTLAADALLAERIPPPFQWIVRRLSHPLGMRVLLDAVASHAWTFVGSGAFRYEQREDGATELEIAGCPACRGLTTMAPLCGFYAASFERLFRRLLDDRMRVREVACHACGGSGCRLLATSEDDPPEATTGPR